MAGENSSSRGGPRNPWTYVNLGLEIAAAVGAGLLAGWFLDRWSGWGPLFLAVGGAAGLALGLYHFLKQSL